MGEWTDSERASIKDTFAKIKPEAVGPDALSRYLVVYPWTKKYFEKLGDLSNAAAIRSNPNVIAHGKVLMDGLDRAVKNLDNIKATYAELRVLHSEKLKVDPDNFKLMTNSITVAVAAQLGKDFTPEVQAAFQKFLDVASSALGKQEH